MRFGGFNPYIHCLWRFFGGGGSSSGSGGSNGPSWTKVTDNANFSARSGHTSAVFGGELWVIGGNDGSNKNDVWKSTDGITWTRVTSAAGFSGRNSHASAVFRGKDDTQDALWIIGGDGGTRKNDVWKSTDGIIWTQVATTGTVAAGTFFSPRYNHTSAVFNNALWVIGGTDGTIKNDVWKYQ